MADLNQAIELDPADGFSYAERGFAFEVQGNVEQAKTDWADGVLTSVLLWAGRFEEKAKALEERFRDNPNEWVWFRLAIYHARAGRLEQARTYLAEGKPLLAETLRKGQWRSAVYTEIELKLLQRTAEELIQQQEQK